MTDLSASEPRAIAGRWRRTTKSECALQFPAEIVIGPGSRYLGTRAPDQGLPVWDAGTARMPDPTTLVMSTSSDELVTYPIDIANDRFTITTSDGCRVTFQRLE